MKRYKYVTMDEKQKYYQANYKNTRGVKLPSVHIPKSEGSINPSLLSFKSPKEFQPQELAVAVPWSAQEHQISKSKNNQM